MEKIKQDDKKEDGFEWHSLSWQKVVQILNSNHLKGLTEEEIKKRQEKFGKNFLKKERKFSNLKLFLVQLKNPLIYILIVADFIVLFLKEFTDAIVIFLAIALNTAIGFFQERKANKTLEKLRKAVKVETKVLRDGNIKIIDSQELVPGDVVLLEAGDKVPADGRVISAQNLKINEMVLTGEWLPTEKRENILTLETSLAERNNMVFMGTIVEEGKGKFIVTAIGNKTEIGKISELIYQLKEEKTPLQKKLASFSKLIGMLVIFICFVIFLIGVIKGDDLLEIFLVSVAIAIAAIPEGLPAAITVVLAIGMRNILKKGGLVRKLSSAETLGSASVIATDKTGTLTEGKMRVAEIFAKSEEEKFLTLKIAALCSQAFIENPEETMEKWIIRGTPTDKALLLAGLEAGINKNELLKEELKEERDIPFSQEDKYLGKLFFISKEKKKILYLSGAPEKILEISDYLKEKGKVRRMSKKAKKELYAEIETLTKKGFRVIGVGEKEIKIFKKPIKRIVFVGLVALKDPLRKEVKLAINLCQKGGLKPVIVTGDHKFTAKAIAEEIGFDIKEENILEGKELDKISDEELSEKIEKIKIYARVEPKHKMRIIQAYQDKGEVVAMTGDGVNDAPALKKADIGIALNSGTEIAKESSDLILLTNSFRVIISAIEQGRAIIDNIRRIITYLFADAFTEVFLVSIAVMTGLPLPVNAVQILWVNLIEDGLPNIALAFEKKDPDVMNQSPKDYQKDLFTKEMKTLIFIIGGVTNFLLLFLFFWLYKYSHYQISHIRTIIFAALTIDSLFYIFSCKNLRKNIWHINILSNKFLIYSWLIGILMLVGAIYLYPLQVLLKTYSLNIFDWGLILGIGIIDFILVEAIKWCFIKKRIKG